MDQASSSWFKARFHLRYRHLFCAALVLALAASLSACADKPEPGSYPAANKAQCLPSGIVLLDQAGKKIRLSSLHGTPVLVDFIYTTCTSTCPLLTEKMASVAKLLGPELGRKAKIVSFTIDPEHDGPAQLANYAKEMDADDTGWLFLTGTPAQIQQVLAIYGLRLGREPDGSIMHMTAAYLLGANGRQVRQYDGLQVSASTIVRDINRAAASS